MATRIGIDTGGTFTDVVRIRGRKMLVHKLRSTPDDPSRAVLDGLAAVRQSPDEPVDLVHGTTVGLNATLTGDLARTVFVTNRGCEDLIEIGRQERVDLYALDPHRAVPPVPRQLRVGVACRRGAAGEVVEALTRDAIAKTVATVKKLRPDAIAIGLLHSPADAKDEHRLQLALQRALPDVPITCSADLLPAFGEYERFSATILNAAIAPVVGRYTRRVADGIGNGTLRLLRSSLGILPPKEAAQFPSRAMFSGPAGGVLATGQVARRLQLDRAAAFDMGGTSADVCLVERETSLSNEGTIAGLPLPLPTVPVHTVAAGGGSIAYADAGGALRVGPQSAGADPGPACYGKGSEPTVTDAHVALGHLGPDTLLAGAFPIDVDASVRAIERLAKQLGMTPQKTAQGILTVADATMARAILVITAERAVDPAHVPLVAYGGAGGLHAASLMLQLGMPSAVMPSHPGAFSAVGLALAGEATEVTEAVRASLSPGGQNFRSGGQNFRSGGLAEILARGQELLAQAQGLLDGKRARGRVEAMVRYQGQGACLRLPLTRRLAKSFRDEHQRRFGFATDAAIEIVQLRARAECTASALPAADLPSNAHALRAPKPAITRRPPLGGSALPIYARQSLTAEPLYGPAIIEESTATTLVPPKCQLQLSPFGLQITRR
ncbi:MAG: N-methylhydantoinase A [Planctomycetota bacterium]